jgi:hypothetical protein
MAGPAQSCGLLVSSSRLVARASAGGACGGHLQRRGVGARARCPGLCRLPRGHRACRDTCRLTREGRRHRDARPSPCPAHRTAPQSCVCVTCFTHAHGVRGCSVCDFIGHLCGRHAGACQSAAVGRPFDTHSPSEARDPRRTDPGHGERGGLDECGLHATPPGTSRDDSPT